MASSSISTGRDNGSWTREQNKAFENALAEFDKDTSERWQNIATTVGGGKTAEQVKAHYQILIEDLRRIQSGSVPIPDYKNTDITVVDPDEEKRLLDYLRLQ